MTSPHMSPATDLTDADDSGLQRSAEEIAAAIITMMRQFNGIKSRVSRRPQRRPFAVVPAGQARPARPEKGQ